MRKQLFRLIVAACLPLSLAAQQPATHAAAGLTDLQVLDRYRQLLKSTPADLIALCKCSELCSSIGHQQADRQEKLRYFTSAKDYAHRALAVNPQNSEANFVMSIAMGRLALLLSGREKMAAVDDIKKYAETAIRCDPSNYKPYHVLARWHYEVSDLNAFERGMARLLYGALPPASLQAAIYNYEKCRSLMPGLSVNYLELAKCYHRSDDDRKAVSLLQTAIGMPVTDADDTAVKAEATELLNQWTH